MWRLVLLPVIAISITAQAPTPSPAKEEAKKEAAERIKKVDDAAVLVNAGISTLGPGGLINGAANLLTGVLSNEIKARIASSDWAMDMTQKYMASAITKVLTKREGEPYTCKNAKVDALLAFVIEAKGMTQEKAESFLKEEPLWKWRKCGYDRVVFTNGNEAWGYDTSPTTK